MAANSESKGIMLFGVRVMEAQPASSFRKSASMNNLAHYHQQLPHDSTADVDVDVAAGYASDDVVHPSARTRDRKRGVPWTEEEHKLFLLGLEKVGKGDWRGISRNFVKTRTPTQVASHAQKYFLRRNNLNRRRRRSSLFDITTDTFNKDSTMEEYHHNLHPTNKNNGIPLPVSPPVNSANSMENQTVVSEVVPSSKMADLNLNLQTVSGLSVSSSSDQQPRRHGLGIEVSSGGFNNSSGGGADSIISVAVA